MTGQMLAIEFPRINMATPQMGSSIAQMLSKSGQILLIWKTGLTAYTMGYTALLTDYPIVQYCLPVIP